MMGPAPLGAVIDRPTARPPALVCFSEDQSRFIVSVNPDDAGDFRQLSESMGVQAKEIGRVGGDRFQVNTWIDVALDDMVTAWKTDWRESE